MKAAQLFAAERRPMPTARAKCASPGCGRIGVGVTPAREDVKSEFRSLVTAFFRLAHRATTRLLRAPANALRAAASVSTTQVPLRSAGLGLCLVVGTTVTTAAWGQVFPLNQCAAGRFGSDLNCTANDVGISKIAAASGSLPSCVGGQQITLDLDVTVTSGGPARWDVGIFISKDGKDPQYLPGSGGAASCNVDILPFTPTPFRNLDGDGCGDIQSPPDAGVTRLKNVELLCQAFTGTAGKLGVSFVVSWDNQASPSGSTCTSAANPVPNTKSKCNSPTAPLPIDVIVLPAISKSDGRSSISPGVPATYAITITNTTGAPLSNAVFTDPAVTHLNVSSVTCSAAGGATCPAGFTVAQMQGGGITIPTMPVGSSVTFSVTATVSGAAAGSISNAAYVTVLGQSNSATDTNTLVFPSLTNVKTSTLVSDPFNGTTNPKHIPGAVVDYTLIIANTGPGTVDADGVAVADPIPANTRLFLGDLGGAGSGPVAFVDGTPSSGLTWTHTSLASGTDDLEFSSNGGSSWTHVPTADANGYDTSATTHIRMRPKGTMAGASGGGNPSFQLRFRVRIN